MLRELPKIRKVMFVAIDDGDNISSNNVVAQCCRKPKRDGLLLPVVEYMSRSLSHVVDRCKQEFHVECQFSNAVVVIHIRNRSNVLPSVPLLRRNVCSDLL